MSAEEVLSKSVIRRLKHQQSPLIEKLLPYCQHKPECRLSAYQRFDVTYYTLPDPPITLETMACTCGLDEIRKELE